MNSLTVFFDIIASVIVVMAGCCVWGQHPVRSAFLLVGCFVLAGVLWLMMHAEFLGLALIFVYVGAVMTLFLFVIMMVDQQAQRALKRSWLVISIVGLMVLIALIVIITHKTALWASVPGVEKTWTDNVVILGKQLYTDYFVPFQLAGVLLLAAIVAAIGLVHRGPDQRVKQQVIRDQINRSSQSVITKVSEIQKGSL